jgi:hypothetical protein
MGILLGMGMAHPDSIEAIVARIRTRKNKQIRSAGFFDMVRCYHDGAELSS